ncbi:MAG: GrpB family protein [Saprospiraceae bacterium]|nr:GrpB family protein [Saprospiraceae bacterium]
MNKKNIDHLTAEDWGNLFPIMISPYNPNWPVLFNEEKERIKNTLSYLVNLQIEHFGSTSVPGLQAKDTIDILIGIPHAELFAQQIIDSMNEIGYHYFLQQDNEADYMVFGKGYKLEGRKEQTFHVHMSATNHPIWERIYFRDFLREHPETAKKYADLKIQLAKKFRNRRVDYRIAKTDFVTRITKKGKALANNT